MIGVRDGSWSKYWHMPKVLTSRDPKLWLNTNMDFIPHILVFKKIVRYENLKIWE